MTSFYVTDVNGKTIKVQAVGDEDAEHQAEVHGQTMTKPFTITRASDAHKRLAWDWAAALDAVSHQPKPSHEAMVEAANSAQEGEDW